MPISAVMQRSWRTQRDTAILNKVTLFSVCGLLLVANEAVREISQFPVKGRWGVVRAKGVWHGGTVTQRHSTFPSESPWKISCHLHLVKCLQGLQAFCRLFWQGRQEGKQTDLSIHQENESQLWRSGRSLNVYKKKKRKEREITFFKGKDIAIVIVL